MDDGILLLIIVCIAIVSYGTISRIRGREMTVLIVLEDVEEDLDIQKGAKQAGDDLKIRVIVSTSLEEDIDEYSPNSIVVFSDTNPVQHPKRARVFNGRRIQENNRPVDSFAEGYLAVLTAHVNFMSEEF